MLSTLKIANVVKKFFYWKKVIDLRFDLSKPRQFESDFAHSFSFWGDVIKYIHAHTILWLGFRRE